MRTLYIYMYIQRTITMYTLNVFVNYASMKLKKIYKFHLCMTFQPKDIIFEVQSSMISDSGPHDVLRGS